MDKGKLILIIERLRIFVISVCVLNFTACLANNQWCTLPNTACKVLYSAIPQCNEVVKIQKMGRHNE